MGDKQSITVIGPADLIERNPCVEIDLTDLMREYKKLTGMMPTKRYTWDSVDALEYLNEPMTKQSRASNWLKWKSAFFSEQYSAAPKKLSGKLNLAEIASGSTSGGTLPKDKKNGNK